MTLQLPIIHFCQDWFWSEACFLIQTPKAAACLPAANAPASPGWSHQCLLKSQAVTRWWQVLPKKVPTLALYQYSGFYYYCATQKTTYCLKILKSSLNTLPLSRLFDRCYVFLWLLLDLVPVLFLKHRKVPPSACHIHRNHPFLLPFAFLLNTENHLDLCLSPR